MGRRKMTLEKEADKMCKELHNFFDSQLKHKFPKIRVDYPCEKKSSIPMMKAIFEILEREKDLEALNKLNEWMTSRLPRSE